MSHEDPVPVEVVRDLLALARALYATFAKMGKAYDKQLFTLRGDRVPAHASAREGGEGRPRLVRKPLRLAHRREGDRGPRRAGRRLPAREGAHHRDRRAPGEEEPP